MCIRDRAKGSNRIYTPGEIEWEKHAKAEKDGIALPDDVEASLQALATELNITLPVY